MTGAARDSVLAASMEACQQRIEACQQRIERVLDRELTGQDEATSRLRQAMRYSVLGGGKRLRAVLVYLTGEAFGGSLLRLDAPAAAVELIHAYSLIHDDLPAMDDDDFRRGQPSNHKVFGEGMAILAGDALLTLAFEWVAEAGERAARPRAFGLATLALARGAGIRGMVRGQARDLSGADPASLEALERLHAEKTGALFRAAVEVGAAAAGASTEDLVALGAFGIKFGVAFQHADDLDDADHPSHASVARARREVLLSEALAHLDHLRRPDRAGALRSLAVALRGPPPAQ
jgi:geranylgeranyl pyrophosphate synthase